MSNGRSGEKKAEELAEQKRRLGRLLKILHSGTKLLVMTHDNPDPDSLASAFALQTLARKRAGIDAAIAYGGLIGRAENRAMIETLHIGVIPKRDLEFGEYDLFALVDTQPKSGNNSLPPLTVPDVVIDQHPMRAETRKARFHDVRRRYGATSTLLTEYLLSARVRLDVDLATALYYGIKSETQGLGREASRADKDAYLKLFPRSDKNRLWRIEQSPLSPQYFSMLVDAIKGTRVHGDVVVSSLGPVEAPDMIPAFADLMLRLEGTKWVLCFGLFRENLHLSLRSADRNSDTGQMIEQIVRDDGKYGGQGMIAGGRIPAETFRQIGRQHQEDLLRRRLLDLLSNPDRSGKSLMSLEPTDL